MANRVVKLQKSFQSIVGTLKKNKNILAVFTFGSIVSGDVWEESDIDLFVVYKSEFNKLRDVYSEVLGVPVHTKILNKESFFDLYKNEGEKESIRNFLITSKLVYSLDDDITRLYNEARYSNDKYIGKWNVKYLGMLLKDLGICRKYLQNGGLNTSYEVLIRVLDNLSKLFLSLNGYTLTKDSLSMATNLDDRYKKIIDKLFSEEVSEENILLTIEYVNEFLNQNIIKSSKYLLDYLEEKNCFLSSYEIANDIKLKGFNIKVEQILKELNKRYIVLKDKREFSDSLGNVIAEENVYSYKNINN